MVLMRLLLSLCLLLPIPTLASNAGIVQGLWYDQEQVFVDQPVRIYVAVRNNTGADLTGTIEFFINSKRIERSDISALDGRIVESWADWNPTYGTSTVIAQLSRTELSSASDGESPVTVVSAVAEDVIFVDYDTDGDGRGDRIDEDDDGDGVSDADEVAAGIDPLVYDEPEMPEEEPAPESPAQEQTDGSNEDTNGNTANTTPTPTGTQSAQTQPQGIEQFLSPSPTETFLSGVTEQINTTKRQLDVFRDKRDLQRRIDAGEIDIPVNEDGFGPIERIPPSERNQPVAEKPDGFFGDLIIFLGNALSALFTGALFVTSVALGYPILMQLLLLFLILFIVYKIARRLGRRNNQ